jgi:Peptidase family M28
MLRSPRSPFVLVYTLFLCSAFLSQASVAQSPPALDLRLFDIAEASSADRIENDLRRLVGFGTRHTLSDTVSTTRGIGAARRWIKSEFESISVSCGGCLEVTYQRSLVEGGAGSRIPRDTWVVNVLAILRGTQFPDRYVIMSGDIDSRVSSAMNDSSDSPGANDNASGMAGVIEAARLLSDYSFPTSIIFTGLSGEEQGLFGGKAMAEMAKAEDWDIAGVLNNDMIGNISGADGVVDNAAFRIFSEPTPVTEDERTRQRRRFTGGEVDGPSRQLARYVERTTRLIMPEMRPMLIYRLDRFGRGGHHRPFNDEGFAGIRIMEAHENYTRQHQDLRVENGISYGDVIEGVDFDYAARMTAVNAINLASIAWAPPAPANLGIAGAVRPSTTLVWDPVDDPNLAGYIVYWRDTTEPQWSRSRFVGSVTEYTLEGIVIDNYLFGVAAVGKDGNQSVVSFPMRSIRR